jgi:hypothetical protein
MPESYPPPFTITPTIIRLISVISEQLGRLSTLEDEKNLRLRGINRIRTIHDLVTIEGNTPQVTPQVKALLDCMAQHARALNRDELQQALSLKDRKSFRERYLKPALEAGLITMTIADKPNSRLQKYRLTEQGRKLTATCKLSF